MDDRANRTAALANIAAYGPEATRKYVDGAPHIKHASLRKLYASLAVQVYDYAGEHTAVPSVLDLGAGEGSATLPFLELGATVTAVDASRSQLELLQSRCERFGDRLTVRCEDMADTLRDKHANYDVIVANSFLHHVPDYLGMIGEAVTLLAPWGQFFSFQDPLRYDSVGRPTEMFSTLAYFSWRIWGGDVVGGLRRRLRRKHGIYLEDSMHDNAEYHATRNGVDQDGIRRLLEDRGYDCNIVRYFSTQSRLFQPLGSALGVKNTFAVIARHKEMAS
jgi:SAM-dependent methyltransferase